MTHTPGPWAVNVNGGEGWSVDFDGPSSAYVTICGKRSAPVAFAVHSSAFGGDDEIDANARLIAAAPELLQASINFRNAISEDMGEGWVEKSRAARMALDEVIARATGEQK